MKFLAPLCLIIAFAATSSYSHPDIRDGQLIGMMGSWQECEEKADKLGFDWGVLVDGYCYGIYRQRN